MACSRCHFFFCIITGKLTWISGDIFFMNPYSMDMPQFRLDRRTVGHEYSCPVQPTRIITINFPQPLDSWCIWYALEFLRNDALLLTSLFSGKIVTKRLLPLFRGPIFTSCCLFCCSFCINALKQVSRLRSLYSAVYIPFGLLDATRDNNLVCNTSMVAVLVQAGVALFLSCQCACKHLARLTTWFMYT